MGEGRSLSVREEGRVQPQEQGGRWPWPARGRSPPQQGSAGESATGIAGPVSESTRTSGRKAARDSRSAGWAGSEIRRGLAAPGFKAIFLDVELFCPAVSVPPGRSSNLRVGLATPVSYLTAGQAGGSGARQRRSSQRIRLSTRLNTIMVVKGAKSLKPGRSYARSHCAVLGNVRPRHAQ